eukprot:m.198709 g.198709  ORF g.198709 m.198709 type:complete len:103 (+) comp17043_c0_seq7:1780-2088(+)
MSSTAPSITPFKALASVVSEFSVALCADSSRSRMLRTPAVKVLKAYNDTMRQNDQLLPNSAIQLGRCNSHRVEIVSEATLLAMRPFLPASSPSATSTMTCQP